MMKKVGLTILAIVLIFCLAVPAMADTTAEAGAAAGAEANNYTTNNSTNYDKRQLPGATGGPVPNMLAPLHNGGSVANLQDVRNILSVRKTYTIAQLAVLEGKDSMELNIRAYQSLRKSLNHPKKGTKGLDPNAKITIVLAFPDRETGELPMPEYTTDIAHITAKAGDTDTDVVALMAASAIEAYRHGATKLVITGQGAKKLLEASGWAIMIGSMGTMMKDNIDTAGGGAMAAGIGYGEVESGYGFEPWFQAYAVK